MPFFGGKAQRQHCLGPRVSPCFVCVFHPPWPFLTVSWCTFHALSSEVFWIQYSELCKAK
jgi:hypothetical protein